MDCDALAAIARETLFILGSGQYITPSGRRVDLTAALDRADEASQLLEPEQLDQMRAVHMDGNGERPSPAGADGQRSRRRARKSGDGPPGDEAVGTRVPTGVAISATSHSPRIEVTGETTLQAARRLVLADPERPVLALNFASGTHPGGGFLGGADAQEESIARASGLFATLLRHPEYYERNCSCHHTLYTDHMILSPDVPVFRGFPDARCEGGSGAIDAAAAEATLLEEPWTLSILTAPAPYVGGIEAHHNITPDRIRDTMRRRIELVLTVAATQEYRRLVLGAWGCGAFGNDPDEVAPMFREAIELPCNRRAFDEIVFAILDRSPSRRFITPFLRAFSGTE